MKSKFSKPSNSKIIAMAKALGVFTKTKSVSELRRSINTWLLQGQ